MWWWFPHTRTPCVTRYGHSTTHNNIPMVNLLSTLARTLLWLLPCIASLPAGDFGCFFLLVGRSFYVLPSRVLSIYIIRTNKFLVEHTLWIRILFDSSPARSLTLPIHPQHIIPYIHPSKCLLLAWHPPTTNEPTGSWGHTLDDDDDDEFCGVGVPKSSPSTYNIIIYIHLLCLSRRPTFW